MLDIVKLPADAKITQPGLYSGIPLERYHSADICDGPSISSSGLRKIFREGPAYYWLESPLNPNRVEPGEKKHFVLGRAAHHLLLGEDDFKTNFVLRPDTWDSWRTGDAKKWRRLKQGEGYTVLEPGQIEQIRGMAGLLPWQRGLQDWGLANNEMVREGILDGEIEMSLFWKDKETGIWLKARPDAIPTSSGDHADLKTTQSVQTEAIENAIRDNGYAQQGALIGEGVFQVFGMNDATFSLVWVEVDPPHCVRVEPIRDADLARGELCNRAAIRTFAKCWENGQWPGPSSEGATIGLPTWEQKKIDDKLKLLGMI